MEVKKPLLLYCCVVFVVVDVVMFENFAALLSIKFVPTRRYTVILTGRSRPRPISRDKVRVPQRLGC